MKRRFVYFMMMWAGLLQAKDPIAFKKARIDTMYMRTIDVSPFLTGLENGQYVQYGQMDDDMKVRLQSNRVIGTYPPDGVSLEYKIDLPDTSVEIKDASIHSGYFDLDLLDSLSFGSSIDSKAYPSLNDAIYWALWTKKTTLIVSTEEILTGNLAIPQTLTLQIVRGGMITEAIDHEYTIEIYGTLEAGGYQIFSGFDAGDIHYSMGATNMDIARPEWWYTGEGSWHTAFMCAIQCLANGGTVKLFSRTYVLTDRVINVSQNYITIEGEGSDSPIIDVQCGGKYAFVSGDSTNVLGGTANCGNITYRNMRFINTTGSPKGIIALYRVAYSKIEDLRLVSGFTSDTSLVLIKLIGSDAFGVIQRNFMYNTVGVGIQVGNGSHQLRIRDNDIGGFRPIEIYNSMGTYIYENNIFPMANDNKNLIGVLLRTDIVCPPEIETWVLAGTQTNTYIYNNWFEPVGNADTSYHVKFIYLGNGNTVGRVKGTVIRDNLYMGGTDIIYVDYADQTLIDGDFYWYDKNAPVGYTKFIKITGNANNTSIRFSHVSDSCNTFTGNLLDYIEDAGENTTIEYEEGEYKKFWNSIMFHNPVNVFDSLNVYNTTTKLDSGAQITLANGVSGWGFAMAGDNQESSSFRFTSDGTVTLKADSTTNATMINGGGHFCIYDAGSCVAIKNNLSGAAKKISVNINYYSP